jgi:hypothetical protein
VSGMGNNWTSAMPERALQNVPNDFNMMDVHDYEADISSYVQQVHGWMTQYGYPKPLWITEWGEYPHKGIKIPYSWDASSGVERIVENMIRGSQPGDDYVYGSHIFSLYDWGTGYLSGLIAHDGSIRSNGYYPFRLAARALQGCRTTYESTSSTGDLMAITTQDASGDVYLLVANSSRNDHTVDADLSALLTSGTGTMWRYDANTLDQIVGNPTLSSGHVTFDIPSNSAIVIQFGGGTPPPPTDTPMPTDTPDPPPTDTPEPPPTDTPEPTATPTEGPSPTPTDTPIPTDTPEPTPTNTPGGGTVMHVEDIYTTDASGNPQDVFAPKDVVYYQVQILDQSSGPVDSASVTTDLFWPDDTLLTTLTSTSGADGWAYFSKRTNPNYPLGTYTIEVANVTKEGATYDPNANVKDVHQFMLQ